MKKKFLAFLFLSSIALASTSCTLMDIFGGGKTEKDLDQIVDNTDYSSSYNNDTKKVKLSYSYKDLDEHSVYASHSAPTTGEPKFLVVPVWFKDSSSYIATSKKEGVREDIQKAFFGTNEETGWRSVRTYFAEESFGNVKLNGLVSDWYTYDKYSYSVTEEDTANLADTIITWYKNNNSTTMKNFDSNNDGYIDGLVMIYAAPNYYYNENSSENDNLWAYVNWKNNAANISSPKVCNFLWASFDFMYGLPNDRNIVYFGGDTSHCSIDAHTYIHETGHMFGLYDYYDYAGDKGYDASGGWIMQSNNVGAHDPYSKMALGWISPYVPTSTCTLEIGPTQKTGDIILLSPSFTKSPFDEYLLIDFYSPLGNNSFDANYTYFNQPVLAGTKEYGCRIWHIDARLITPSGVTKDNYPKYTNHADYFTTNPTQSSTYGWEHATANTSYTSETIGYASPLAASSTDFKNFRLLQLIRANKTSANSYKCGDTFSEENLFTTGDTFNMTKYQYSFYKAGKLNTGKNLNISVSFRSVTKDKAIIDFTF